MWQTASVRDSYRAETQDRSVILPRPQGGVLLVVADGVGGRFGGARAAQLAVELVAAHESGIASDAARWAALIAYIDSEIVGRDDAGQTMLVLAEATELGIVGASVGDSRALFFADSSEPATDLTEFQQRKPFVGTGSARPKSFSFDCATGVGGTLLAASDGLFDYAEPNAIDAAVRQTDLGEATRQLAVAARGQHSNHLYDDLTILLCRR